MKQTQNTHACSLAGEGAAAYSLASGEAAACSLAQEGRQPQQSPRPGEKIPKPLLRAKQNQQPSAGLA